MLIYSRVDEVVILAEWRIHGLSLSLSLSLFLSLPAWYLNSQSDDLIGPRSLAVIIPPMNLIGRYLAVAINNGKTYFTRCEFHA